MSARNRWSIAIAILALAALGTAVTIVANASRDAQMHEGRRLASMAPRPAEAAPADTGAMRGGQAPKGQAPVVAMTVLRFLTAFNAEADDRRLLILLSPT